MFLLTAWKIRFNGFGRSDYSANNALCGLLETEPLDEEALAAPPFYQPQGASHFGGSFAVTTADIPKKLAEKTEKMTGGKRTPADRAKKTTSGCGMA